MMSQNSNSAKVLQTKCILVWGGGGRSFDTCKKVPRGLHLCVFYVIGKPKKKGLSIMLLMVSGHIPIMPYNSKKSVKV